MGGGKKTHSEIFQTILEINPMMDQKTIVSTINWLLECPWAKHDQYRPASTPLPHPFRPGY